MEKGARMNSSSDFYMRGSRSIIPRFHDILAFQDFMTFWNRSIADSFAIALKETA